jgi:hypothetical protein
MRFPFAPEYRINERDEGYLSECCRSRPRATLTAAPIASAERIGRLFRAAKLPC